MTAPWIWSVAGSDSSGGAGLQADLKTFANCGVRGASITTALTAQSLHRVYAVEAVGIGMLEAQWQALAAQGPPAAIKVGMLQGAEQVAWLARRLADYPAVPVVCDPVLLASDGTPLQQAGVRELFLRRLLPHISLLTPNLPEARWLLGAAVAADADAEQLAAGLRQAGAAAVLVKGGHGDSRAEVQDFFTAVDDRFWLTQTRLPGFIHGSGCILAAAAAAALARGYRLDDAVVLARRYLQQGWRLAAATGTAEGWFCHAGWPQHGIDLPQVSASAAVPVAGPFAGMGLEPIGLYPVVDSADWIARLLPLGISTIQLRIKQGEPAWLRAQVAEAIALGRRYRARVFINDHWELALELGAWGVHLGQEDLDRADLAAIAGAGLRLGLSNHSEREIARAHALRPSYLALGPIYDTTTKVMRFAAQGLARLRGWVGLLGADYPLVAIGGIDAERLPAVLATGVGNVAVVRAITEAADPAATVRQLRGRIAAYRQ